MSSKGWQLPALCTYPFILTESYIASEQVGQDDPQQLLHQQNARLDLRTFSRVLFIGA
ncbi:hypothetical protein [Lihuaxuella thermophila]|uniref:Uncharacterized protein n=1 Tax=Lihuaxuella thermophila TaxID=1173111 RepID=A0A1H8AI93_9BACL|nr:hypothetical protein [Lihuaxuella thermophila]SEM69529.1 hypothetical protein SAMN05444955_101124 [Lihuaxuella thermophila]